MIQVYLFFFTLFSFNVFGVEYKIHEGKRKKILLLKENIYVPQDIVEMSSSAPGVKGIFVRDVHGDITAKALTGLLDPSCIELVIKGNHDQDAGKNISIEKYHFDDNAICEGIEQIQEWKSKVKEIKDSKIELFILGKILHSVQDFYSHSNYLERAISHGRLAKKTLLPIKLNNKLCKEYKQINLFTANNNGLDHIETFFLDKKHLRDSNSHLYWNKDFDPIEDNVIAAIYSRSSFKEYEKVSYFSLIFDTQVKHSIQISKDVLKNIVVPEKCN